MKKLFFGIAALSVLGFSACSDDDDDVKTGVNTLRGTLWEYTGYVTVNGDTVNSIAGSYPNEDYGTLAFNNDTLLKVNLRHEGHELKYTVDNNKFNLKETADEPTMDVFFPDFYFCSNNGFTTFKQSTTGYLNLYVNKELVGEKDSNVSYLIYENLASHVK